MSFGRPKFTKQEMLELEVWWAWYNGKRMASPNWPPKWKPARPKKRWRKK